MGPKVDKAHPPRDEASPGSFDPKVDKAHPPRDEASPGSFDN